MKKKPSRTDPGQVELPFSPDPAPTGGHQEPLDPVATRGAPDQLSAPKQQSGPPQVLSVARLDFLLKQMLEGATVGVRVRGELSGLRRAGSGHAYFTLKDERQDAVIDCVMYRSAPARAHKQLRDGERIVLQGQVTLYPPRGRLQLVANNVLQSARGELLEALERLKRKLAAEGLFDAERKRALPPQPRTIAVLTSRQGAAIHDVVRVAFNRGRVRLLLVPTPVQGTGAAERIAAAIRRADELPQVDVLLVTRGGGSVEDLAAYNHEAVVRAIAAARRPVVCAIGHEIDTSLAELAADHRAATPSQAAELLVADERQTRATLQHLSVRLVRAMRLALSSRASLVAGAAARLGEPRRMLLEQAQRFDELSTRLERATRRRLNDRRSRFQDQKQRLQQQHPRQVLASARLRLSPLEPRLRTAMSTRMGLLSRQLEATRSRLQALSPLGVLARGYAIATTKEGRVIHSAEQLRLGEPIDVRLHRGSLTATVSSRQPAADDTAPQDDSG